jgi:large subunit ribosomal protein L3
MLGLLGKKLGQTRVYNSDGTATSVTVVECGPNHVVQCKTTDTDGYSAVQLAFDPQKDHRLTKPKLGHFSKHKTTGFKRIREFRDFALDVKSGDVVKVEDCFDEGDFVDAIGLIKGRGFQGVMKRWNFSGGRATHGAKGWKRRPGSIGSGSTPGWVAKGKKMPGHMGQAQRTIQSLKVVKVRGEDNLLLIKGAIPGAAGDYVVIREAVKKPKKKA